MSRTKLLALAMLAGWATLLTGCASYTTPGAPADFTALGVVAPPAGVSTDFSIEERLARKPAAAFPAHIAVARVQGAGYRSMTVDSYGYGQVGVVTTRDVEKDEQVARIAALPGIAGLAPVNRLLLPGRIDSELDLRRVAASVQADMLLLYTFDTRFNTGTTIPALGVVTLGLFPNKEARVTSTASAVLLDTRTGYVYGVCEATAQTEQLANAWSTKDAVDQARRRAETRAFDSLVGEFEKVWTGVAARFMPSGG